MPYYKSDMTTRRRRRKQKNSEIMDVLKLMSSIGLIVIAVLLVVFVYGKIRNSDLLDRNDKTETSSTEGETETLSISSEQNPGLNQREDGALYYLEEDGKTVLKDSWKELDGALYYFNQEGLAQTGVLGIEGMVYTFSKEGKLEKIKYNPSYQPDQSTQIKDYPSLARSKTLWAFLREDKKAGSFYAIMYKKTTEAMAHPLGGENNPQFTSPYSMQIEDGYIYYLPYTKSPSDMDLAINQKLYRMKPGAERREIVAEKVEGYKVFHGTVYYYADGKLQKTSEFTEDTAAPIFAEDGEYYVDITSGKAILKDAFGRTVEMEEDAFKAGNFTYALSANGEILDVKEKRSVNKGGYTYSIEEGTLFGETVSRVVREDASGKKEVISSEFRGTTGNLHYDYDSGAMFAEYQETSGKSRILRISLEGDVEYLEDDGEGSGTLQLIALQDNEAVCREEIGGDAGYVALRTRATVPLAISVEPIPVETSAPAERPAETESGAAAPGDLEPIDHPGETEAVLVPTAPIGPGAGGIPDEPMTSSPVETIGPGEGALVGGAP